RPNTTATAAASRSARSLRARTGCGCVMSRALPGRSPGLPTWTIETPRTPSEVAAGRCHVHIVEAGAVQGGVEAVRLDRLEDIAEVEQVHPDGRQRLAAHEHTSRAKDAQYLEKEGTLPSAAF